ncbi:MAG: ProQ/FINO family protein [Oceanococcus sp.]
MSDSQARKKNQQRSRRAREEWLPALIARYPKSFFDDPRQRKPLKIGVHKDILADDANELASYQLTSALRWYTGALGYQLSIQDKAERIDLNGEASGQVTAEDATAATAKVKLIRERMKGAREQKQQEEKSDLWLKKLSKITT